MTSALKKTCGREDRAGACGGRVDRVTPHVGKCDECGAIWWVQRKTPHQSAREERFDTGLGAAIWVMHELLREIRDLNDTLQGCLTRERMLENALTQAQKGTRDA